MKVLVVAEGKHELSGALENLLKRLGGSDATFEFDRVSNRSVHTHPGKAPGHFKRAMGWLREAEKRGVDALVFLIDEDGRPERVVQLTEAQNSTLWGLRRALGVAIRSFDAWMLADETAMARVLGHPLDRQRDPETIRNPKQICADLLAISRNRLGQAEMYARIAQEVDLELLKERCPKGFRPFSERVQALFV